MMKIGTTVLISVAIVLINVYGQALDLTAPSLNSNQELIAKINVEDNLSNYFTIENGTKEDGQFIPTLFGSNASNAEQSLIISGGTSEFQDVKNDEPVIQFVAKLDKGLGNEAAFPKPVQNRLLFGWSNSDNQKMVLTAGGYLGIGTESPASKLQVKGGDIYIENMGRGIIMKSPNGKCWRTIVANDGNMVSTLLPHCPVK